MSDETYTCRDVLEYLADYLDGNLAPEQSQRFEDHLSTCRSCTAYLAGYRETILMARAASNETEVVEDLPDELVQTIVKSMSE